jgi:hypothetical protein
MLVITDERLSDFEMPQQIPRVARILGRDYIDGLQNFQRAQGDVVEIPNRRGHDVKHPGIIDSESTLRHRLRNNWASFVKRIRLGVTYMLA